MDSVIIKENPEDEKGIIISIFKFHYGMSKEEKLKHKGKMHCEECNGKAYYRKDGTNGMKACYGAKHEPWCTIPKGSKANKLKEGEHVEKTRVSKIIRIVPRRSNTQADLNSKTVNTINESKIKNKNRTRNLHTKDSNREIDSNLTITKILKFIRKGILSSETYDVHLGNRIAPLCSFVIDCENLNEDHIDQEFLYTGSLSSFRDNWLNTSYENNISILVSDSISKKFWKEFEVDIKKLISKDSDGNLFLIWGTLKRATSGKYYIRLSNLGDFDIIQKKAAKI